MNMFETIPPPRIRIRSCLDEKGVLRGKGWMGMDLGID
jgi:hypothetical protein